MESVNSTPTDEGAPTCADLKADTKLKNIFSESRTLSFEFFPPKSEEGVPLVFESIERLQKYNPNFVSVTSGAGGSTHQMTEEIVILIKEKTNLLPMAHLTCVSQTKEAVHEVLLRLERAGIENVIALRGDPPVAGEILVPAEDGFAHASDLIKHIKSNFRFGIAAACYPEGHMESRNLELDIEYTKRKVDMGAEVLISQLFYNSADFLHFLDRARKARINVPIIPGIMPILRTSQILKITSLCGASIPPDLNGQLVKYATNDKAIRDIGIEHSSKQAQELWDNGVDGLHFYVLNRSYSVSKILSNLAIVDHDGGTG